MTIKEKKRDTKNKEEKKKKKKTKNNNKKNEKEGGGGEVEQKKHKSTCVSVLCNRLELTIAIFVIGQTFNWRYCTKHLLVTPFTLKYIRYRCTSL